MEPSKELDSLQPVSKTEAGRTTSEQGHDVEKQGVSGECCTKEPSSLFKGMGILDRFLGAWIFLAMAVGIILGNFVPNTGPALQKGTFVGVSIPIGKWNQEKIIEDPPADCFFFPAIGLLVMMYPILCKVKYETLHRVFQTREIWIQLAYSVIINWIIAPFLMVRASLH